jgi:hypothetical protein
VGGILRRIGELPREDQREAVMMLLVLSGLRGLKALVADEVKRMPVSIDIHENEFLEDFYQHGRAEQKFGVLPNDLRQLINDADSALLQPWIRRIVQSSIVDEIFQ